MAGTLGRVLASAFGAGFLEGWAAAGTRPEFDIVTGVSTGALLATHAFLGTPEDDELLKKYFTGISAADIYRKRSLLGLLWGHDSYFDTSPMAALLDKFITAETLQRVAAAHDQPRACWWVRPTSTMGRPGFGTWA